MSSSNTLPPLLPPASEEATLNVIARVSLRGEGSKPVPVSIPRELLDDPNATIAALRWALSSTNTASTSKSTACFFKIHENDLFVYPTSPVDYIMVPKSRIVPLALESRLGWQVLKHASGIPTIEILIGPEEEGEEGSSRSISLVQRVRGRIRGRAPPGNAQQSTNHFLARSISTVGTTQLENAVERLLAASLPPPEDGGDGDGGEDDLPPILPTTNPTRVPLSDIGALLAMTTALTILRNTASVSQTPAITSKPSPPVDDDGDAADIARFKNHQWNDLIRVHKLLYGVKVGCEDGPVKGRKPLLQDISRAAQPEDEDLYEAVLCHVPTETTMFTVAVDNNRDCKYTTQGWTKLALKVSPPYITVIMQDKIVLSSEFLDDVRHALQPLEGYRLEQLESLNNSPRNIGSGRHETRMGTLRRHLSRLPFNGIGRELTSEEAEKREEEESRPQSPARADSGLADLKEARDEARRRFQKLFEEYGEAFALEVTLGGPISDVQRIDTTNRREVETKSYEMETELSAAVLGLGLSSSVHDEQAKDSNATVKRSAHMYRYRGGEPKMAGEIDNWKVSLQRDNWITCKTDKVVPILDLVPQDQPGFENLKRIIEILFPKPPLLGRWVKGSAAIRGSQEFMGREVFYSEPVREGWYIVGQSLSSDRVLLVKERDHGAICPIERTIGIWNSESRWWTKHDEYLFDLDPVDPVRYATIGSGFFMIPRMNKEHATGWSLDDDQHMPLRFCAIHKDFLLKAECRTRIWSASRYWKYPTTWFRPGSFREGTAWRIAAASSGTNEQVLDLDAFRALGSRGAPTGNIWMLKKSAIAIINDE
ncbi:hypothetical protein FRC17_003584 [Serendipita sp. 399]|nr:hypothetical protein FRC17_003584 [Serendipita sp. 399]